MCSDVVLRVEGLTKCYRSYRSPTRRLGELLWGARAVEVGEIRALDDVSFTLRRGEIFGVIGPNGAGKSTLLQMIAGTLRPSAGRVEVTGRLTALLELGAGVDREMTGRENVFLMGGTYGIDGETIRDRMEEIIAFSGLGDFIEQPVKTYSSGMFVRLAFSVSTALDPDVLIVDEALSVGDVGFQAKCLDRLEELIQGGSSILLASHDLQLIKTYCSSAICLSEGAVIERGDPETVTERYFYLMRSGGEQADGWGLRWSSKGGSAVRFGSEKGEISAVDVKTPSGKYIVATGDEVTVTVGGRIVDPEVTPAVSLVLRDVRGYNLYGLTALAAKGGVEIGAEGSFTARFTVPLHLAKGQYSFTVRLEDHRTDRISTLLDKHVGVCRIAVEGAPRQFLGAVNLFGSVDGQSERAGGEGRE